METLSPLTRTATGPTWEVAHLYPHQGDWSEEQYLQLTDHTNKLIEFTDGRIEFLPMPTRTHQRLLGFLCHALHAFLTANSLGEVLPAGYRIRVRPDKIREPDLVVVLAENAELWDERYGSRADLAIEILSADDPKRDRVEKRKDYAEAGIGEYWIVDPLEQRITVLSLRGDHYEEHGIYAPNQRATSALLPGFEVDVQAVFAAGRGESN